MIRPGSRPSSDQFAGSLVGQCLGDALGFLGEGRESDACREYLPSLLYGEGRVVSRGECFVFGQYTDDSQLAREVMISFVDRGCFDPADFARRIARLFVEERIVGRGLACERAARRLAEGAPWDEAGEPEGQAGNGAAMRAGPVGLMCCEDARRLSEVAHDQGRITHRDLRSSAGSVAIAGAVALALRPGPVVREEWLETISTWAQPWSPILAEGVRRLEGWLEWEPGRAVGVVRVWGYEEVREPDWPGISPFVVPSVLWSLYSFLRSPDDYVESVRTAIECGGDVDSTAAMTGAIGGARVGLAGLPQDLARRVNDDGEWGYDALVGLAEDCHAVTFGQKS